MDITILCVFLLFAFIFGYLGYRLEDKALLVGAGFIVILLGIGMLSEPITNIVCVSNDNATSVSLANNCITITESDFGIIHSGVGLIVMLTGIAVFYAGVLT